MEFWGAEVKSGQTLSVQPGDDMILHLSQASLGESKMDKASEPVSLFVTIDRKKLVLGTLSSDKLPQQRFDLVFDKDFELSHNWKNGSVYFFGYKAANLFKQYRDTDDSDEEIPLTIAISCDEGLIAKAKQKVKAAEPSKGAKADDGDESSDEDDLSEDEGDSEMREDEDDSDEDQSDEEETPKKVAQSSKKRPATKSPSPHKKTKFVTRQKTDGKKGAGGSLPCMTCGR
ncbi:histone deacetylase HDT1-like [Lycium ferocissimum]|uniref:histone deacetylase HDT1-like n=1 Tax=Lycium ferocissimum TaxID=112874 RepID=UPI002814B409|nr:histone deacetylase HDT1-like [Lycium ferocissimum]